MKNTRGEREGGRQPHSQTAASVMYMITAFSIHEEGDMYILDGGSHKGEGL